MTLTIASWVPIGDKVAILAATDNFYGRGTLVVENVSTEALTLYMPVGTLFPGSEARLQVMGGYPTAIDLDNPGLPRTGGTELPLLVLVVAGGVLLLGGAVLRRTLR